MVTEYWDMFCEDGFCRPIRGFSFQTDKGSNSPIFYKTPRYGAHEYEVIQKMVKYWTKKVWWNRATYHGEHWWFYLQNHTKKMCHGTSTSGGCVCPTENLTRSPSHLTSPYLAVMMQYRTLTQKKIILLLWTWKLVIGK